jgi:hypothetical protein
MFVDLSTIQDLFTAGQVNWPAFLAGAGWAGGALMTMAAAHYHGQAKALRSYANDADTEIDRLKCQLGVADNRNGELRERIQHLTQVVEESYANYDALARSIPTSI